jgi:hypothetical protein
VKAYTKAKKIKKEKRKEKKEGLGSPTMVLREGQITAKVFKES